MPKAVPFLGIAAGLTAGALFAAAGSSHGLEVAGWPAFAVLVAGAFLVQWIAFIPAWFLQTERFFDLTGSLTFLVVVGGALAIRDAVDLRSLVIGGLVAIWAMRLGPFLFLRVRRDDHRRRVSEASAALIDSPAAILSFAEGTRFTEAKSEAGSGQYDHVLPPRAGGLAAMIEALTPGGGTILMDGD